MQPKLSIGRNNGWIIHAYAGTLVRRPRRAVPAPEPATGQWVTLRKVLLEPQSSARLVLKLPKGMNHLRVTMSVNQAGAGFLGAYSARPSTGAS